MAALVTISDDARDVLIAVNPHAGAGNRRAAVDALRSELERQSFHVAAIPEIERLVSEAVRLLAEGRLRAVVAAGGDGTLRLVAERMPPGTPLVILPLGTENLLARYLELPADGVQIAQVIAEGRACRFDAGEANGRLFSLMAGCGFDADVVRRLARRPPGQHSAPVLRQTNPRCDP